METISKFRGKHRWLSNFWMHEVTVHFGGRGMMGPSAEHVYQAMKAGRMEDSCSILSARTPGEAKRLGSRTQLRPDWDRIRIAVMHEVLKAKFAPGSELAERLLLTGEAELRESNTWGDTFWGITSEGGQNWLGRLLMLRRSELLLIAVGEDAAEERVVAQRRGLLHQRPPK